MLLRQSFVPALLLLVLPIVVESFTTPSPSGASLRHDAAWALRQSSRTLTLPVPDTTVMENEPYFFANQQHYVSSNNNNNGSILLQRRNAVAPALSTAESSVTASPAAKMMQSFQRKLEKWGGLSTVMSYYFVSHINSAITITLSWYIHAARVRCFFVWFGFRSVQRDFCFDSLIRA